MTSLLLTLFITNLNQLALKIAQIRQNTREQDQAITALLLLKQQIAAAGLSPCIQLPAQIHNITHHPEFASLAPYQILTQGQPLITAWHLNRVGPGQMLGNQALLLHQRRQTFTIDAQPKENVLIAPSMFTGKEDDVIIIDDCHQALLTTIQHILPGPQRTKILRAEGFIAANYHYPLSISHIENRIYYLGKTLNIQSPAALYRSNDNKKREQILPNLSAIDFNTVNNHLQIEIKIPTDHEPYYVSV